MHLSQRILVYGYGNPGRQDDGLGNRFVEELEKWIREQDIEGIALETNYQLNIEDSVKVAENDMVIFVDASEENIEDIDFSDVEPSEGRSEFTSHAASPAFVLALCIQLYDKHPKTSLLQIRGFEWEFKEGLTAQAEINLQKALKFFKGLILSYRDTNRDLQGL